MRNRSTDEVFHSSSVSAAEARAALEICVRRGWVLPDMTKPEQVRWHFEGMVRRPVSERAARQLEASA